MIIDLLTLLAAAYAVHLCLDLQRKVWRMDSRVTALENQKHAKPEPKAPERVQARQIWDKEIEGFNPKAPKIVLPRNEEQKANRVYTDWEIDSDFKIVG